MLLRQFPFGNWTGPFYSDADDGGGGGGTTEEGQPDSGAEPAGAGQPFHSWTAPDGRALSWKDANELNKFLTGSAFMQSDYSKKTEELKREREAFLQEQEKFKSESSKLEAFRKGFQQHPELFSEFEQRFRAPASTGDVLNQSRSYVDEKLAEILEKVKAHDEFIQDSQFDRSKQELYNKLKSEYEDFDPDKVEELLSSTGTSHEALVRLAYRASKGDANALNAQQLAAEEARQEARLKASVGNGGKPPAGKGGKRTFKSIDEARDAAHADIGE